MKPLSLLPQPRRGIPFSTTEVSSSAAVFSRSSPRLSRRPSTYATWMLLGFLSLFGLLLFPSGCVGFRRPPEEKQGELVILTGEDSPLSDASEITSEFPLHPDTPEKNSDLFPEPHASESAEASNESSPLDASLDPERPPSEAVETPHESVLSENRIEGSPERLVEATPELPPERPSKGTLGGTLWITYYYLAREADYTGVKDTILYDASCKPIQTVAASYSDAVCIEGSGKLLDGRVINVSKTCTCGRPCRGGKILCYQVIDPAKFPWGMGARSNPLVPFRSIAVDRTRIPLGTVLYLEGWDGLLLPSSDGLGGWKHDGCFRADDVGGAIQGDHIDIFAGSKPLWKALEAIHPTRKTFSFYTSSPRCASLVP